MWIIMRALCEGSVDLVVASAEQWRLCGLRPKSAAREELSARAIADEGVRTHDMSMASLVGLP